jgi:hypothetical protein
MPTRPNFLPNEQLRSMRPILREQLDRIGEKITPDNFPGLCDGVIFGFLQRSFSSTGGHEGSIWLLDRTHEHLTIAYNTGPDSARITGFKQPIREGIVSMVLQNEQSFMENEVYRNEHHSKLLDNQLGVLTYAMIVVPFYFLSGCRGVISCVQLVRAKKELGNLVLTESRPPGFTIDDLSQIEGAATIIRDLLDFRLMKTALGWE